MRIFGLERSHEGRKEGRDEKSSSMSQWNCKRHRRHSENKFIQFQWWIYLSVTFICSLFEFGARVCLLFAGMLMSWWSMNDKIHIPKARRVLSIQRHTDDNTIAKRTKQTKRKQNSSVVKQFTSHFYFFHADSRCEKIVRHLVAFRMDDANFFTEQFQCICVGGALHSNSKKKREKKICQKIDSVNNTYTHNPSPFTLLYHQMRTKWKSTSCRCSLNEYAKRLPREREREYQMSFSTRTSSVLHCVSLR